MYLHIRKKKEHLQLKWTNQIDEDVKNKEKRNSNDYSKRYFRELNKLKIGKIYDIIVEGYNGEYYYGRNYEMAPEIDGKCII